jgi:heme/copper-type cytochrome/quinol oxidase subunit 2
MRAMLLPVQRARTGWRPAILQLPLFQLSLFVAMSTDLRDVIFWIAVVSCAIAQLFIIRAVVMTAPHASSPSVPTPRRSLEIAWAVLPAVLLVAAFVGAWRLMYPAAP